MIHPGLRASIESLCPMGTMNIDSVRAPRTESTFIAESGSENGALEGKRAGVLSLTPEDAPRSATRRGARPLTPACGSPQNAPPLAPHAEVRPLTSASPRPRADPLDAPFFRDQHHATSARTRRQPIRSSDSAPAGMESSIQLVVRADTKIVFGPRCVPALWSCSDATATTSPIGDCRRPAVQRRIAGSPPITSTPLWSGCSCVTSTSVADIPVIGG